MKLRLQTRPQLHEIVLMGEVENKEACKKKLSTWVKNHSQLYLRTRLKALSALTGLTYTEVSIRGQRSRWGSCSAEKAINLNFKLMFLPPHLVDHIIIHELCHTVHLNHSTKFWRLVASFDALWKKHSSETRQAEKFVPSWVE